ncbi:MAG: hypothetical protein ONB46_23850 [candidate division KSB1 bacterium]|nr:hypothetical protein [candidate division KSB1 bacterium]
MKPQSQIDVIAFDADDTLWHNEHVYLNTHEKFKQLLRQYHNEEWIDQRRHETEIRNRIFCRSSPSAAVRFLSLIAQRGFTRELRRKSWMRNNTLN